MKSSLTEHTFSHGAADLSSVAGLGQSQAKEELFIDADAYFKCMLHDIRHAKHSIDLEVYIFGQGPLGKRIVAALMRAARRGVVVRVLVDGAGTPWWGNRFADRLEQAGAETRVFHPFPWQLWNWSRSKVKVPSLLKFIYLFFKANSRNHRKVVVIDQHTAYLGSINMTRDHLSKERGGKGWRDIAIRLERDKPFDQLLKAFDCAWTHRTITERIHSVFTLVQANPLVRLNYNRHRRRILYKHLLWKIQEAEKRIWITNAYFVPDNRMLRYLRHAAERGVDVRILLPRESDIRFMPWASAVFYYNLLKSGIRIFEYLPGVLHAKSLIIDDWMLLGSSNLNQRSLRHDLEADVNVKTLSSKIFLEQCFINDLADSQEMDLSNWTKYRPRRHRFFGRIFLYMKRFI